MKFEEQFLSLKELTTECRGLTVVNIRFIKEHCLDKQRVLDVIDDVCKHEWENCGNRLKKELDLEVLK